MSDRVVNGIHELTENVSASPYWNHDIAPTTAAARKWGTWDIAALWVGMSVCNPTYMLAGTMIAVGMTWWQSVLTILLGNLIVLIPMVLNAHPGTKYGIPFPVYCRASFGVLGSNVPAILRAIVACGWFGIQTWLGGFATYTLMLAIYPGIAGWGTLPAWLGINVGQLACFLVFWLVNMIIIWRGMESIRFLEDVSAPFLIIVGVGLLGWAYWRAGGLGPMFSSGGGGNFWAVFPAQLTAMVGFWATLSLNIPDFSRFARTQKDQILGQTYGLPSTMTLYSFVGVAVTSACLVIPGYSRFRNEEMLNPASLACKLAAATDPLSAHLAAAVTENTRELIGKAAAAPTDAPAPDGLAPALAALLNERIADPSLYEPGRFAGVALDPALRADLAAPPADAEGKLRLNRRLLEAAYPGDVVQQNLWDPVTVCGRFENPIVVAFAILALWIATLTTNLAANVVSPANDISNLAPRLISFRTGGMITGVVGILMMPWKLLASTQGYIFTWLIGYGALLGPIGGILIADYFVLRSKRLRLADLYRKGGTYWYQGGFNERAILALLLGVLPNIPGFLAAAFPGWVTTANGKCLIPGFFVSTYQYAWFVGFAISFVSYILLMAEGALAGPAEPSEQPAGAAGKTTAAAPDSAGPSEVPGPAAASSPSAPRPGGAGQSGSGAIEFGG